MSLDDDSVRSLSLDYLNLLINGEAFSDVTFSVEGRLVHAHRCILAARSLFFRKFFCGSSSEQQAAGGGGMMMNPTTRSGGGGACNQGQVIPVNSVGYEVFMLLLQFLYSGQVSILPHKHEPRPNCGERACWHTHCTSAVDLALDTLSAARSFGVEQLAFITQKQLASMVEKASIEDVMKVLIASRKQDMQQLWASCSQLVAKSGLPPEVLAKHLPIDVVAKIEELRLKSCCSIARRPSASSGSDHHHRLRHGGLVGGGMPTNNNNNNNNNNNTISRTTRRDHKEEEEEEQKIRRMRRALDCSDVELVKLMVMGEGLNLDEALALHYAVENCSREVVKALLELGAADVNYPAGPTGKTPLHTAAEMVSPDMVAVLLDHHADPNVRTLVDGVTPLDILRTLTSDFLFKGAVPGLAHIEPNKLRLCLELVQSAAMVISREQEEAATNTTTTTTNNNNSSSSCSIYAPIPIPIHNHHQEHTSSSSNNINTSSSSISGIGIGIDSRMVYLNLGGIAGSGTMPDHHHHQHQHSSSNEEHHHTDTSHGNNHPSSSSIYHHHHNY